ncbi:RDD family protein [Cesiribacter andamanensis]|uniref:RDD family protein n=1 Tax=Cesiribacter andamanensis AMV16 TaxID=1279009 RepID=M7N4Z8_9BACT|nr:RDD family protein [Cesiribacter andamanensis]EMR02276.1 RDD family protein [Cesiribacter andamanensis AMV16]
MEPNTNFYSAKMAQLSDRELRSIATYGMGYDEKGRRAAEWELARRGQAVAEEGVAADVPDMGQAKGYRPLARSSRQPLHEDVLEAEEEVPSLIPETNTLVLATSGKRFLNLIIDYVAAMIFATIVEFSLISVSEQLGLTNPMDLLPVFSQLIWFFWSTIYYTFFEYVVNGKTIGKMLTRTRVVNEEGEKPRFTQILGRSFARLIPFDAFSFLGDEARGWHDRLPKTLVIDDQKSVLRADYSLPYA